MIIIIILIIIIIIIIINKLPTNFHILHIFTRFQSLSVTTLSVDTKWFFNQIHKM